MLDNCGRDINYLRLSITDLCNLKCSYCSVSIQERVQHSDLLTIEQMVDIIKVFHELGINKVRITGGEPLIRKGIVNLVDQLSKFIDNVSLSTNGLLLSSFIDDLSKAGLKSVNISLDTLDYKKYLLLTKGNINEVIDGIKKTHSLNIPIKINSVLMKGINDSEIGSLLEFCELYDAKLRFIELMPFEATKEFYNMYYISSEDIINKYQMKYLYSEGTAEYYQYKKHVVGFIRPISKKFCSSCNRIRMTSRGDIISCLHSSQVYNINEYINDHVLLKNKISEIICKKLKEHHILDGDLQSIEMRKIGG